MKNTTMYLVFLLIACNGPDPDCDDDFEERDGICYEEEPGDDDDDHVVGGPLTDQQFRELFGEKLCAEYMACNPETECSPNDTETNLECDFDRAKAQECLNGVYECDDSFGEGFEYITVPAVCGEVYTNCTGGTSY